jgi:hypothetical protein
MASNYLYCEETDIKIYPYDIVTISSYPNVKFIAKLGWYNLGSAQNYGWYFINISDKSIIYIDQVDITTISKDVEQIPSQPHPTTPDIDPNNAIPDSDYIVIPDTNIRIYDGDIVTLSNTSQKWIVHTGWYTYNNAQNYGWYFCAINNGDILPLYKVDLTLCTLVTTYTQGSNIHDGPKVNYTRPFTEADSEILNRTFITIDTIEQLDNIDTRYIPNGRIVRVNGDNSPSYYIWNLQEHKWENTVLSNEILKLTGNSTTPIILSQLDSGLYRLEGVYQVTPSETRQTASSENLLFVNNDNSIRYIKLINNTSIFDYITAQDTLTTVSKYIITSDLEDYATIDYVDNQIDILESYIHDIEDTLMHKVGPNHENEVAILDDSGQVTFSNIHINDVNTDTFGPIPEQTIIDIVH